MRTCTRGGAHATLEWADAERLVHGQAPRAGLLQIEGAPADFVIVRAPGGRVLGVCAPPPAADVPVTMERVLCTPEELSAARRDTEVAIA